MSLYAVCLGRPKYIQYRLLYF